MRGAVGKRNIQTGGEDHVVLFCAGRRIGHVDVAELILPAEPLADLSNCAEIEGPAILAGVLQIGIEIHVLRDHGSLADFLVYFLALE